MKTFAIILTAMMLFSSSYAQDVIFSELNYNSAAAHDTEDWFELYNRAALTVDLAGWVFKDSNDSNEFVFPSLTFLEPGEYLVVVNDSADFEYWHPDVTNYIGRFDFNLSNGGELIRLYNAAGTVIDSLTYDDADPWPNEPDGQGYTLTLIYHNLPGYLASSWGVSDVLYGTPGESGWLGVQLNPSADYQPVELKLQPCYPNPFNPETRLSFDLPAAANVTLAVYDVQGNLVTQLANGWLQSGVYETTFDAGQLAGGVYIARLSAGDYQQTQKLILLK